MTVDRKVGSPYKARKGAMTVEFFGVFFLLMLFALFFMEVLRIYNTQYAVEVLAQRAVNSAVEASMIDEWRADGYNYMSEKTARELLPKYLKQDLAVDAQGNNRDASGRILYHVDYDTGSAKYYSGTKNNDGISIPITVTVYTRYATNFGGGASIFNVKFTNVYDSRNFRDDNDYFAAKK